LETSRASVVETGPGQHHPCILKFMDPGWLDLDTLEFGGGQGRADTRYPVTPQPCSRPRAPCSWDLVRLPRTTTSETANRPAGFNTRNASTPDRGLSRSAAKLGECEPRLTSLA